MIAYIGHPTSNCDADEATIHEDLNPDVGDTARNRHVGKGGTSVKRIIPDACDA